MAIRVNDAQNRSGGNRSQERASGIPIRTGVSWKLTRQSRGRGCVEARCEVSSDSVVGLASASEVILYSRRLLHRGHERLEFVVPDGILLLPLRVKSQPNLCHGTQDMTLTLSRAESAVENTVPPSGLSSSSDSGIISVDATMHSQRVPTRTFSHYELLELIGEGQFGTVWRANDQRLDRIVALKLPHLADFDEKRQALFLREARAAATLEHAHIVQVYGVERDGDQLGIVSQFIEGKTLLQMLQIQRPSFEESARIVVCIADAVHHAHEAGVIHRDIKPSNILMDLDGEPHVSDFGLAKWSGDQTMLTSPGIVLGTPAYMSPEQARGDSHLVDRRSDVYSLGVLLYELLTGKPPFEGNSTLLLHQIQSQDPRAPRTFDKTIPLDLETICLKCLAKSPDDRYSSARELKGDVLRFLGGEPVLARPISSLERGLSWARRNRITTSLAAVSILSSFVAVGLGASLVLSSNSRQPTAISSPVVPAAVQPINVTLNTEPEGATVVFYPIDAATGEPILAKAVRPTEKSPVTVPLLSGDYLVVAALDDGRFHEVYRCVPREVGMEQRTYFHCSWRTTSSESISLFPVKIPTSDDESNMSLLANGKVVGESLKTRLINPFLLDQREVTIGEFTSKYNNRLPPSLNGRRELLLSLDLPIPGLFFDEALAYAELSGKRLPTAMEYEFAATNGWTTLFPWGDTEPPSEAWHLTARGNEFDKTLSGSPVYGLFSNASEFVYSGGLRTNGEPTIRFLLIAPDIVGPIVRGGPISTDTNTDDLKSQGAYWRMNAARTLLSPFVGFRCAKSKTPRL